MAVGLPALVFTLLSVAAGGVSLVVRFRRARGEERQQLRWVASAAVAAALGIPVAMAGILIEGPTVVGLAVSAPRRSSGWPSRPRSSAIGCTTWTTSSAGP
jgi:hypothetical protein